MKKKEKSAANDKRMFTNGHKTFTTPEAAFLTNMIEHDYKARFRFNENLYAIKKDRNTCIVDYPIFIIFVAMYHIFSSLYHFHINQI